MLRIQVGVGVGTALGFIVLGLALWLGPIRSRAMRFPLAGTVSLVYAAIAVVRVAARRNALPWMWRLQVIKGTWPGHPGPEFGDSPPVPSILHWWNAYQLHLRRRFALLTASLILLAVAYSFEGNPFSLAVGAALPLAFLGDWTTRRRFEHWVRARRAAVQRLRRNEVPSDSAGSSVSPHGRRT